MGANFSLSVAAGNIAAKMLADGYPFAALDAARESVEYGPDNPGAFCMLGLALAEIFRPDEAIEQYRKAIELCPQEHMGWSNLFLTLLYRGTTNEEMQREQGEWAKTLPPEDFMPRKRKMLLLPPWKKGRIRVGFQSADFCWHPVGRFLRPLLEYIDHERFEIYCYCNGRLDNFTPELSRWADHWFWQPRHEIESFERQMCEDRLDILFDLAGHTDGCMLPSFAKRMAPIQISYLGYPFSTSVPAMDYRIVSELTDPPGTDQYYSEKLIRLPGGIFGMLDPISAEVPRTRSKKFDFCCFNRTSKYSVPFIDELARRINADNSVLLKARDFQEQEMCTYIRRALVAAGASGDKVRDLLVTEPIIRSHGEHLEQYNRTMAALDTFPYSGTTTTFDALQMGVSVLDTVVAAPMHVSRVSWALQEQHNRDCPVTGTASFNALSKSRAKKLAQQIGDILIELYENRR